MLSFALRDVLGIHIDLKGFIVLPEKLRYTISHGKPVQSEKLRNIKSIVNEQIEAELDVFLKESTLADARRVNGLRAVFGEIYPDPEKIVSIGEKVEDLLANPDKEEWPQHSAEHCGGTHMSNTREPKAFVLLYEEGLDKGVCRVTFVAFDAALEALISACSCEQQVSNASIIEASLLGMTTSGEPPEKKGPPPVIPSIPDLKFKKTVTEGAHPPKAVARLPIQSAVLPGLRLLPVPSQWDRSKPVYEFCLTVIDTPRLRRCMPTLSKDMDEQTWRDQWDKHGCLTGFSLENYFHNLCILSEHYTI